jgi:hypothetical protein
MKYEGVGLIFKVKTYNFDMNFHVVHLKLTAVVNHTILISGTTFCEFREINSIKVEFNLKFSQQCCVSMCSEQCHCVKVFVEWVLTFQTYVCF